MARPQHSSPTTPVSGESAAPPFAWYGAPQLTAHHVTRPRLGGLLDAADAVPLVLVSAPAGSGKTTAVAEWVAARSGQQPRIEWVTLEPADEAFWSGLVGGLELLGVPASPASYAGVDGRLDRRQLASLASSVASQPSRVVLVVDGYELVSSSMADDLDFLLRHSGHRLQLVLVTRLDPVLPLYHYRLDGSVAEVRIADLRFTDGEASRLLEKCGVKLRKESVAALNEKAEGWVAGLRFAARFLEERTDADDAVAEFPTTTGNIAEYLLGEVLRAQTPEVRDLLLATSVVDTLRPGLAETLGGRTALRTLDQLAHANAFVEAVPGHPGVYRLHPFFRDLLRAELAYESPVLMRSLHRRAAEWFAEEGMIGAAARHYSAIRAWPEASRLVVDSLALAELFLASPPADLAATFRTMPDDVDDPAASLVRAALAMADGDASRFAAELAKVHEPGAAGETLELGVAVLEAMTARYSADPDEVIARSESVERGIQTVRTRAGVDVRRSATISALAHACRGAAHARAGRLAEATDEFTAGAGVATAGHDDRLRAECLSHLAVLAAADGNLSSADAWATEALDLAESVGIPPDDRPVAARVALAATAWERDDLRTAARQAGLAERVDGDEPHPVTRTMLAMTEARLCRARGDMAAALATLEAAANELPDNERWWLDELRIATGEVRLWQGEPDVALLEVEDVSRDKAAAVALAVAQAALAQGHDRAAADSLTRVLETGTPPLTQIRGWLLESSRQLRNGFPRRARTALDRSLRLAAPEGVRRPFREAAPAVRQLLADDPELVEANQWLVDPAGRAVAGNASTGLVPRQRGSAPQVDHAYIEALTAKETEVLGLLAELLTTEEIAEHMFVSVNTTRTHVRSILRKLGVSRRNAAVRRARELHLLTR